MVMGLFFCAKHVVGILSESELEALRASEDADMSEDDLSDDVPPSTKKAMGKAAAVRVSRTARHLAPSSSAPPLFDRQGRY
jgi:hypothetical protein